jgi:hypothetical protein
MNFDQHTLVAGLRASLAVTAWGVDAGALVDDVHRGRPERSHRRRSRGL